MSPIANVLLWCGLLTFSTSLLAQPLPEPTPPEEQETPDYWYRTGATQAAERGAMAANAKNIILFLADGMGMSTVTAARILEGQRHGQRGEEHLLSWESFPHTAFSKTYTVDSQVPDSAGTMTAITTGVKTRSGAIAMSASSSPEHCQTQHHHLLTWLELANSAGMDIGIVTTARLTHATPAAAYTHVPDRQWENDSKLPPAAIAQGCQDIAQQMVQAPFGNGPRVLLGGGWRNFAPTTEQHPEMPEVTGARQDQRHLIHEWQERNPEGYYVWNRQQFEVAKDAPAIFGLFAPDHMDYEFERFKGPEGAPSLEEMTRAAIRVLSHQTNGYALVIEAARIDHAHHQGTAFLALDETIELSRAVRAAMDSTSADDTLIIVTADHSHALTLSGYPIRGNPILGEVRTRPDRHFSGDGLAQDLENHLYTTLQYANGPGYATSPDDVRSLADPFYQQRALIPLRSATHSGEDVGIWARGPGSSAVRGTLEQNVIYHIIVQAVPRLRQRLCDTGQCNHDQIPIRTPKREDFLRQQH